MLDLSLEHEIILLAIIVVLIAWFMGRALCKSREYQVHSSLKEQRRENKRLETLLSRKDNDIHDAYDNAKIEQQKFIDLKHQYEMNSAAHDNLQKIHHETLKDLQRSHSCQVKLTELGKHHDEMSAEYLGLKNTLHQTQEQLQESRNLCKQQKHELERYKADNEQLTNDNNEQARTIAVLQASLDRNQKLLQEREQNLQDLYYQLETEKTKNKQLLETCDSQLKSNTLLKDQLEQTQEMLQKTIKSNSEQKKEIEQYKSENSSLRNKVKSYEILSTIR